MLSIEHPVLPASSRRVTQRSRRLIGLKLVAVVCIFEEEMKMGVDMHVYDDWSIMHNIMVQILEVLLSVSQFFYSLHQGLFSSVV
jgi:hypothetical protein